VELLLFYRGDSSPFQDWLSRLKDARTVAIVRARLYRIQLGNFGDCRAVGDGVEELRIDYGPGYRVYFGREGSDMVVLLAGGDKKTQAGDIARARRFWKEYLDAKKASKNKAVSRESSEGSEKS
jgi:putative addiction module killer protein